MVVWVPGNTERWEGGVIPTQNISLSPPGKSQPETCFPQAMDSTLETQGVVARDPGGL